MLCTIKTSNQTAIEVARLLTGYGITLDDFLSANLGFLGVALPSISDLAAQARGSAKPNFADDICGAVLPCLKVQSEFRRVGAHIDDTIIRLRAQKLAVECMRDRRGNLPSTAPAPRRIQGLVNPWTYLSEAEQILAPFELEQLRTVGTRLGHPYLYFPGPVFRCSATAGPVLDLNKGLRSIPALRGVELERSDIDRWLPLLQYYDLVQLGLNLGQVIKSDEGTAILAGFASLLSELTEVVCFLFAANLSLAQVSYREDLLAIHERGLRLAAAWERTHLEVEVTIHQLNGHLEVMVPALLLLASGVAAGEDIFGEPGTAREPTNGAPVSRRTPTPG